MSAVEQTLAVLRETIPAAPAAKAYDDWAAWLAGDDAVDSDPNAAQAGLAIGGFGPWRSVSLAESFQVPGVLACLDVIAQDISKATFRLKKRLLNGGSQIVSPRDHPVAAMLALEPHEKYLWGELFEMTIRWLVATQDAFLVKGLDREGTVTELIPLMTTRVLPFVDPTTGAEWYNVTRGSNYERALLRNYDLRIPEQNIIRIRMRIVDGFQGYSSLLAGRSALMLSRAINAYQERLYATDGRLKGVVSLPAEANFGEQEWNRLLKQWTLKFRKMHTHNEPLLLEGGAKFERVSMTAADADVAKVREQQALEIAKLFRVPPHKIMHFDPLKYTNLEAEEKVYLSDTLLPIAKRVEETLGKALLSKKERLKLFFEFDRDEMAAADSKTRAQIAKEALERTAITIDEYRAKTGDDPLPNGAGRMRLLPVNFAMIDESNKIIVQGATRAQVPEGSNEPPVPGIDAPADAGNSGENSQNPPGSQQIPPKNANILSFLR